MFAKAKISILLIAGALGSQACARLGFDPTRGVAPDGGEDAGLYDTIPIPMDVMTVTDLPAPDIGSSSEGWVTLQPGSFYMGSPASEPCREPGSAKETRHKVTLTRAFELQVTEVTQGEFSALMGYNPADFPKCGPDCPVESVTWSQAAAYCNELSSSAGLAKCYECTGADQDVSCTEAPSYSGAAIYACPGFRLPTEAEWEYAYRAGTSTAFYSGQITSCEGADPEADKIGWYKENTSSTRPVRQKLPNPWGLYGMPGNVGEWCHDRYIPDLGSSEVKDPFGSATAANHLLHGGAWYTAAERMRAAHRYGDYGPTDKTNGVGFRCCRTR
jgi:formylglycine-generating enzyme required for sulfatase activity